MIEMTARTTPKEVTAVSGYPSTLRIYRIEASSKWQCRLLVGNKYARKSTATSDKAEAIEFAKRFYDEIRIRQRLDLNIFPATFNACTLRFLELQRQLIKRGEVSRRTYNDDLAKLNKDILPYFRLMTISDISKQSVENYLETLSDRTLS